MQILVSLVVTHNHPIMYAKGFTHIYQYMLLSWRASGSINILGIYWPCMYHKLLVEATLDFAYA